MVFIVCNDNKRDVKLNASAQNKDETTTTTSITTKLAHKLSLMNFNDAFVVICLVKSRSSRFERSILHHYNLWIRVLPLTTYGASVERCHDRRIRNWVILTKYGIQWRTTRENWKWVWSLFVVVKLTFRIQSSSTFRAEYTWENRLWEE